MMPFTEESYLQSLREAAEEAVRMLKDCYGEPSTQPRKDSLGRTLLGFGRDLFARKQSQAGADLDLREDVQQTQQILAERLFGMLAVRPETHTKVASLLVIADLVGPETIRDCAPLWAAIKADEWTRAGAVLLGFDWSKYRAARQHTLDVEAVNLRIMEIAMGIGR